MRIMLESNIKNLIKTFMLWLSWDWLLVTDTCRYKLAYSSNFSQILDPVIENNYQLFMVERLVLAGAKTYIKTYKEDDIDLSLTDDPKKNTKNWQIPVYTLDRDQECWYNTYLSSLYDSADYFSTDYRLSDVWPYFQAKICAYSVLLKYCSLMKESRLWVKKRTSLIGSVNCGKLQW